MTYHLHCLICGTPFTSKRSDAKTCCEECRFELSNMKKRAKDAPPTAEGEPEGEIYPVIKKEK